MFEKVRRDMKKSQKMSCIQIIKCFVFLLLLAGIFWFCKIALIPSSYVRVVFNELKNSDENYDCIILGASHARSDIDPFIVSENLGVNAINIAVPGEKMDDSYYILKEAMANNTVKKVILDLDYQYWYKLARNDFADTFIYEQLTDNKTKFEYAYQNLLDKDFRVFFARYAYFIDNYNKIESNIKTKLSKAYKECSIDAVVDPNSYGGQYQGRGFFYNPNSGDVVKSDDMKQIVFDADKIDTKTYQYFLKIVEYCKSNNIELICITSPIARGVAISGDYEKIHNYFDKICKENNINYFDFNYVKQSVLDFTISDYVDYDGHMTGDIIKRYTAALCDVIKQKNSEFFSKSEFFYNNYDELVESIKSVEIVWMNLETDFTGNEEDSSCTVSLEAKSTQGKDIYPMYRIEVVDVSNNKVVFSTEYSEEKNYLFKLSEGKYYIFVYGRTKGTDVPYEQYNRKTINIADKTVNFN